VHRLRQLTERTPASRERSVDLLRALAITAVVLGHWLVSAVHREDGRLAGESALDSLKWGYPFTWLFQVLPVFFIVGGYANAASLRGRRERGGDAAGWLVERSGRLIRPTTALFVVLAAGALIARLLGVAPDQTRTAVWVASIPLWFLSAYLVAVVLAPVMYALHERFGLAVPLLLLLLVALGDVGRLLGPVGFSFGNFLFGWLLIHQVGFFWRDGRLPFGPRAGMPVLLGGLAVLVLLTVPGPYPVNMVDIGGQRLKNASPPSIALLATATAQLGLIMLLHDPAQRWLRRPRPWRVVVAMNAVVLTIFLWHMSAVLLVVGVLLALGVLPTPPVASAEWALWRLPWLLLCVVALAFLTAVFSAIELRGSRPPRERPRWLPAPVDRMLAGRLPRAVLVVASFGAVVYGLLTNNLTPETGDFLFGMPTAALVTYLAGAALLRLLRAVPPRRPG
jgi:peptidoglycan/LPS O-acetylase OafA/YrhL